MKSLMIVVYDVTLLGGAEKVALNLANELVETYNISVVSMFNSNKTPIIPLNTKVKLTILSNSNQSLTLNVLKYAFRLRKLAKEENIDSILGITAGMNSIIRLATFLTKIHIYYAEHSNLLNNQYGSKHRFRQWIGAKTFTKTITLTNTDRNEFITQFNVSPDKVITIFNYAEPFLGEVNYKCSTKFISVGRLVKVKGYDRMVRIAKELSKHVDFTWDIYGDGPEMENIDKMIRENRIEKNLTLKGAISDINEVLGDYSLFISTSTFEGLPLSFLEAQNHKLPIISFDCPTGPKEIIKNNDNGILVQPYLESRMVDEILSLLNTPNRMEEMSNSINLHDSKFNKSRILNEWIRLFNNA